MERIRETEVNSDREVCDVINRLIDNQNRLEGELLKVINRNKKLDAYNKAVEEYNGAPIIKKGDKK